MKTSQRIGPFLIALSLGLPSAFAKEETTVTPVQKLTPQQAKEISDAGVRTLVHIAEARGNLHNKKYTEASQNLNQAQVLVDIIKAEEPTYRVKNRIWVAQKHLEYEDVDQVKPDLVPIYADVDFLATYVPTAEARKHLDKAKDSLNKGDKKTAQNEFRLAGQALTYKEIDLPVGQTESLINSAKAALAKKDYAQADKDLKMAEQSVQVTESVVAAPVKANGSATAQTPANNIPNTNSAASTNSGQQGRKSGSSSQSSDPNH
jgi:hypothetical protein